MRMHWLLKAVLGLLVGRQVVCAQSPAIPTHVRPPIDSVILSPSLGDLGQLAPTSIALRPPMLAWQAGDGGDLELAVWADPKLPSIWGAIRNASDDEVRYCNYALGYFGSVHVFARQNATAKWQKLPRKVISRYVLSAGPVPKNFLRLGAGKEMPPSHRDTWLRRLTGPQFTFYVDLEDFQWPKTWSGEADVYVTHSLSDFGAKDTWNGTLPSAPLTFRLGRLRPHVR